MLDASGNVLRHWMDKEPAFSGVSSVERVGDMLWLGTLNEPGVGVLKVQ